MWAWLLLVVYIFVAVSEIILYIRTIKGKNRSWLKLIIMEVISLIAAIIIGIYFNNLPGSGFMPGLTYLGEWLFSMGATVLYFIILFVTICSKIIVYEKSLKRQGKKYAQPLYLILAVIFIIIGFISLCIEVYENKGEIKAKGTIIAIEDRVEWHINNGIREQYVEQYAIISFNVNGTNYTDDRIKRAEMNVGDVIDIYCKDYPSDFEDTYKLSYHTDNKIIYIPLFVLSAGIIILRFKDYIFKGKK